MPRIQSGLVGVSGDMHTAELISLILALLVWIVLLGTIAPER